jgi:hypothetical protein
MTGRSHRRLCSVPLLLKGMGPKWAGAPEGTFRLTNGPLFSIRKVGSPPEYFGPRDSFGFTILDLGQIKIGPAVQIVWPRKASSSEILH